MVRWQHLHPMRDWQRWLGRAFFAVWLSLLLLLGTSSLVQALIAGNVSTLAFGLAVFGFMLFVALRNFRSFW